MLYPGMPPYAVTQMFSSLRGLVITAYGTGNFAPMDWLKREIERHENLCVLVVSSCLQGCIEPEKYGTASFLSDLGIMDGRDLCLEAALVKLMCGLGQHATKERMAQYMSSVVAGEFTPKG